MGVGEGQTMHLSMESDAGGVGSVQFGRSEPHLGWRSEDDFGPRIDPAGGVRSRTQPGCQDGSQGPEIDPRLKVRNRPQIAPRLGGQKSNPVG